SFGVEVTPVTYDAFVQDPAAWLEGIEHVIVAGVLDAIKAVLGLAMKHDFSIGLIPTEKRKGLARYYDLPTNLDSAIELALRQDAQAIDIILCNGKILLFKAIIGTIPLIDTPGDVRRRSILLKAKQDLAELRLHRFNFITDAKQKIKTAACGCMIVQHHQGSLASRLISHDSSFTDAMISLVIVAPFSMAEYLSFLLQTLWPSSVRKRWPSTIGLIKTQQIDIESGNRLDVLIDGECSTHTPLHCEIVPAAVRVNIGAKLRDKDKRAGSTKRKISIDNLPKGKELLKTKARKLPFFSYASEERFRDLFSALREDAKINSTYLVLMVLSTMLATIGLYLDNAAVIIGAMLLAPLMTPIVSFAMGLLRSDQGLLKNSAWKILIGITIALLASSLIAQLFPHKPMTEEMQGRLNPTLLDLAVAIISGVAAAYSKSYKEIIQSLAGVAIAVALVPPLAVAGIGIGRGDFYFFFQAFLLFSTNLIGIILAATYTFRVLGYSSVVRSKHSVGVVLLFLGLIAVPLYLSYDRIVEKMTVERNWQKERFLVNGKYIIIQKANLSRRGDKQIIMMELLAREHLTREDLTQFREKIQTNFNKKLIIRATIIYIP
ncbi:MAG: TIGR00341 family protein, partial [Gammaproteobacteria bacterium]|nr:TIGR00341 family protein [Gammaproteobacteria bacterium]